MSAEQRPFQLIVQHRKRTTQRARIFGIPVRTYPALISGLLRFGARAVHTHLRGQTVRRITSAEAAGAPQHILRWEQKAMYGRMYGKRTVHRHGHVSAAAVADMLEAQYGRFGVRIVYRKVAA